MIFACAEITSPKRAPSSKRVFPCADVVLRLISSFGIAGSDRARRRAVWQGAALARPPKPSGSERAKGFGEDAIGVEHFDADAGLNGRVKPDKGHILSLWD